VLIRCNKTEVQMILSTVLLERNRSANDFEYYFVGTKQKCKWFWVLFCWNETKVQMILST